MTKIQNNTSGSCGPYDPPFKLTDEQLREKISCVDLEITTLEGKMQDYIDLAAKYESKKRREGLTEREQKDYDDVLEFYLIPAQEVLDTLESYLKDCETDQENRDNGTVSSVDEGHKRKRCDCAT